MDVLRGCVCVCVILRWGCSEKGCVRLVSQRHTHNKTKTTVQECVWRVWVCVCVCVCACQSLSLSLSLPVCVFVYVCVSECVCVCLFLNVQFCVCVIYNV